MAKKKKAAPAAKPAKAKKEKSRGRGRPADPNSVTNAGKTLFVTVMPETMELLDRKIAASQGGFKDRSDFVRKAIEGFDLTS